MKFIKIAYNEKYLNTINVPQEYHEEILQKINSLPKKLKKKFINDIKKISLNGFDINKIRELKYETRTNIFEKIKDPYIKLFVNKYGNTYNLDQFQYEDQIQQFIATKLLPELERKIDPNSEDNYYLKGDKITVNEIMQGAPPNLRNQIRNMPDDEVKQTYLKFYNTEKQRNFNEWWKEVYDNEYYSPAFQFVILDSVFKTSDETRQNPVKIINAEIVADISQFIQENEGNDFNINDKIKSLELEKEKQSGNIVGSNDNGWIRVKSFKNDSENFDKNVERLVNFSCNMGWCIANKNVAEHYLKEGDVYIYLQDGKTLVGLALNGDKNIKEIQGKGNVRPFPYWEEIVNFVESMGFNKDSRHYKELEEAKIINKKVETDPSFVEEFKQKLLRNPEEYDKLTKENKAKFSDTIKELEEIVTKSISENGYPPHFARNWVTNKLESGNVPESWINAINKFISKRGYPPKFAMNWATNQLESGNAPESWINAINEVILERGNPPGFAYKWAQNQLESGNAPESWINIINKYISENGYPPNFAFNWARNQLKVENPPESLINTITKYILNYGKTPRFAENWIKNQLKSENPHKSLINIVNKFILESDKPPRFAYYWAQNQLESENPPESWINKINEYILKYGEPPYFATNWYERNKFAYNWYSFYKIAKRK